MLKSMFKRGTLFKPFHSEQVDDYPFVPRFSSLSGCLNPLLRRFAPRVYSPLPGGFLFPKIINVARLRQCATTVATSPWEADSHFPIIASASSRPIRFRLEKS